MSAPDSGFTLLEVIVSTVIIGIVMTSLMTFFSGSVAATGRQFGVQVGAQLADDALEKVRSLRPSAINDGRDRTSVLAAWNSPATGVQPYLADSTPAWDTAATSGSGATAVLPTVGVASATQSAAAGYYVYWYIGTCWQAAGGGGDCTADATRPVPYYRVVIAVTWQAKQCASATCSYITSTLIGAAQADPLFNPNGAAKPPAVNNPGAITGDVTLPASRTLTASGGAPPITWSDGGTLPTGLSIASNGVISGTPGTVGSFSVLISATDGFGLVGTAAFTWTINQLPALTAPANKSSPRNAGISPFTVARTGGSGTLTWSATGLPVGISINSTTGVISGTPTTVRAAATVTVTVTDSQSQAGNASFTWAVT